MIAASRTVRHPVSPRNESVSQDTNGRLREPGPGASVSRHTFDKYTDDDNNFSNTINESLNQRDRTPAVSSAFNDNLTAIDYNALLDRLLDFAESHTDFAGDLVDDASLYPAAALAVTTAADHVADALGLPELPTAVLAAAEQELERIGLKILSDREDARHAAFLDAYENGDIDADGEAISQWNDWRDPRGFRR
jgi:hypothetical protein